MKLKISVYLIFITLNIFSQECYVTAKSGLNVREKPNLDSNKIGKLTFKEKVNIIEDTYEYLTINEKGREITGYWVKVRNNNIEGYVFEKYLKLTKILNRNFINILKNKEFTSIYKENGEWVNDVTYCNDNTEFGLYDERILGFSSNDNWKRRIKSVQELNNHTFKIELLHEKNPYVLKIIDYDNEIVSLKMNEDTLYFIPQSKIKKLKTIDNTKTDCYE